ncbi:MAG: hypothetical protein LC101_10820 [Flavobacteriales bacterium]|nr:hypothetical protein [Flavobacteriales bacterium]
MSCAVKRKSKVEAHSNDEKATLTDTLTFSNPDSLFNDSIKPLLSKKADTVSFSLLQDSTRKQHKSPIPDKVDYEAQDSAVFDVHRKIMYLYDTTKVHYQTIQLEANYIELNINAKELRATGSSDTTGKLYGNPIFTDNEKSFTSKEINYNFDTKKGLITEAVTNEGDAYLHAALAKKDSNNVIYVKNAKFTTCIDPEPHFYIQAGRGKVIPDKLIVTGPAYLRIENIPTPLVVPFGYFPTKKNKSSGLILPEYGELANYGFFLRNLGYYFAVNDYFDITLNGDIYTSLSFGARVQMNYKKRYKFTGNIALGYSQLQYGDPKIEKEFRLSRDFKFTWNHQQDPKANPTITFSAAVNVVTASFNQYNASNVNGIVQNQFQSNIAFSKTFRNTPFSISLNLRHSQNTQTRQVNLSLPDFVFNVTRFFPFRRKKQVGELKWYENIGMTYSMNIRNDINTTDTMFVRDFVGVLSNMNNGIQQRMSISTNVKMLKYITFTPSVNYIEKWHFSNLRKAFDPVSQLTETDTIRGFFSTRELNATASLTTIIYGMYQFKSGGLKAIRHVMTPTITANFRPDLGDLVKGYFGPNGEFISYSPNQIGIFGASPSGMSGTVGFSINNNIEMKVRSRKDTITGEKKIPLLEVLTIGMNYDFARDSLNLSNLSIAGRTTLFNLIGINFALSFDPYAIDYVNGQAIRVNRLQVMENGVPTRLTMASLNINFSLRGESKRKSGATQGMTQSEQMIATNPDYYNYVDFNIPYTFSIGYNIAYNKPLDKENITHAINLTGDVNITKKWKIGLNLNYDIQNNKISTSQITIYRDMHCWEMRASVIPFGIRQSYMFTINVKSPLLQMLKLQRQSGWANIQ